MGSLVEKVVHQIHDELIYKLSSSSSVEMGRFVENLYANLQHTQWLLFEIKLLVMMVTCWSLLARVLLLSTVLFSVVLAAVL